MKEDSELSQPGPSNLNRKRKASEDLSVDEPDFVKIENYASHSTYGNTENVPKRPHKRRDQARMARKRKFLHKAQDTVIKRARKYYYISDCETKPKKITRPRTGEPFSSKEASTAKPTQKLLNSLRKTSDKSAANGNEVVLSNSSRYNRRNYQFMADEARCGYWNFKTVDLSFHIFDEIALEGLDGITLEALWKRLYNVFPVRFSQTIMNQIWEMICKNKHVRFYVLDKPRQELVPMDRVQYLNLDSGYFIEKDATEFKDIYPVQVITNQDSRGSCSTFYNRKENSKVRRFSLQKAMKLYGQKLVLVASQHLRYKSIYNEQSDPANRNNIIELEYCILERIGRARDNGELTQGKISLSCLQTDTKSQHHNRKNLQKYGLIAAQSFFLMKSSAQLINPTNITCNLVHLPRFYRKRRTRQSLIMSQLSEVLRNRPDHQIDFKEFRRLFGYHSSILKMTKCPEYSRFFKTETHPYRYLYPKAPKSEYRPKSLQRTERLVKVIKLIDPYVNVTAALDAMKESQSKKNKNKVEKSDAENLRTMNQDFLRNVYCTILAAGQSGLTIQEVYNHMKVHFYSARMAIRILTTKNLLCSRKIDLGRQQSSKYYAKYFTDPRAGGSLTPIEYKPDSSTLNRILKDYENIHEDSLRKSLLAAAAAARRNLLSAKTSCQDDNPVLTLTFEPQICQAYLTDLTLTERAGDLTVLDIVKEASDRLLLSHSNLFEVKSDDSSDLRDDFLSSGIVSKTQKNWSKFLEIFQSSSGQLLLRKCLATLNLADCLKIDNQLVFDVDKWPKTLKLPCRKPEKLQICQNYRNPHSNWRYFDFTSVCYLLYQCMFAGNKTLRYPKYKKHLDKLDRGYDEGCAAVSERGTDERFAQFRIPQAQGFVNNKKPLMEEFLGPKPVLISTDVNQDGIKTDIYLSTPPEEFKKSREYRPNASLTPRFVTRAQSVLDLIFREKIVHEIFTISNYIKKQEEAEGYDKVMCRKSVKTLLKDLVGQGYVKVVHILMQTHNIVKTSSFICEPTVDPDHPKIQSAVDQLKMKFYTSGVSLATQTTLNLKVTQAKASPFNSLDAKSSSCELRELSGPSSRISMMMMANRGSGKSYEIAKKYGYLPKFVRMRVLHEFLFYLVRDPNPKRLLLPSEVYDLCSSFQIEISQEEVLSMPPVHAQEISWKTFIPPLPSYKGWPPGWVIYSDVILRLPVSVFVKLFCVQYDLPELEKFLNHPVKRHFLIKHLPADLRQILMYRHRYVHNIYEILTHLCYIGLLQLGPRNFKEKDQIFVYLNQNASLLDTCGSAPSYHCVENKTYPKLSFKFRTASDLDYYWSEMWRVSLNTSLGRRKVMTGQYVTIQNPLNKEELQATLRSRTATGVLQHDNGELPGDQLGAAGVDSSLWSFVKRNWLWGTQKRASRKNPLSSLIASDPTMMTSSSTTAVVSQQHFCVGGLKRERMEAALPQPIRYELLMEQTNKKNKKRLNYEGRKKMLLPQHNSSKIAKKKGGERTTRNTKKKKNDANDVDNNDDGDRDDHSDDSCDENNEGQAKKVVVKRVKLASEKKKVVFIRKVMGYKKKEHKREYYDLVDNLIMKRNRQTRVEWDENEDQLLRFCRMACTFLCPVFKKQFIPYNVIRDVIHRLYPRAENKSSRACQRRLYFLLQTDEIIGIMEANVKFLLNNETIWRYFSQIHMRFEQNTKYSDSEIFVAFIYMMSFMYENSKEVELLLLGYIPTVDFFSPEQVDFFEAVLENIEMGISQTIHSNPKNKDEIVKSTIKSIIHCSMSCRQSPGWAYQLYQIYSKLPDDLIRDTVDELKKSQLLTAKKGLDPKNLGYSQIPLKFSHLYNQQKVCTYSLRIYRDSYEKFKKIIARSSMEDDTILIEDPAFLDGIFLTLSDLRMIWQCYQLEFDVPSNPLFLNPNVSDHSDIIEELAKLFRMYLVKVHQDSKQNRLERENLDFESGIGEATITQEVESTSNVDTTTGSTIESVKNQIMQLVFRVPYLIEGSLEVCFKKLMDSKSDLEINNYLFLIIADLKTFARDYIKKNSAHEFREFIDTIDEEEAADHQPKLLANLARCVFVIQNLGILDSINNQILEVKFRQWQAEELGGMEDIKLSRANAPSTGTDLYHVQQQHQQQQQPKVLHRAEKITYGSGMEICLRRALNGEFPTEQEIRRGMMLEQQQNAENCNTDIGSGEEEISREIPHITDLVLLLANQRFSDIAADDETVNRWRSHFIFQYPKLRRLTVEKKEEFENCQSVKFLMGNDGEFDEVKRKFERDNIRTSPEEDRIVHYVSDSNGSSDDLQLIYELLQFVHQRGELGVLGQDLREEFSHRTSLNLADLVRYLCQIGMLLRTGVTRMVYVHHAFESEWIVPTFALTEQEKEVFASKDHTKTTQMKSFIEERLRHTQPIKVNFMPWIKLDGSLNEELFVQWLGSILSFSMDNPGVPFYTFCEQFCFIKPVDLYALLEVLQDIKCVRMCVYSDVDDFLSGPRDLVEENQATGIDNFDQIYIKPLEAPSLHFGIYLEGRS